MSFKCRAGWSEDICHISDEEWFSLLDNVLKVSLSSAEKLTKIFIIHIALPTIYISGTKEIPPYVQGALVVPKVDKILDRSGRIY